MQSVAVETELPRFRRPDPSPARRLIAFLATMLLVSVGLWALTIIKPYRVASASMSPTAITGQRILADHLGDQAWRPKAGTIVVFKAPGGAVAGASQECGAQRSPGTACQLALRGRTQISFVKRVVGVPGDRLRVAHGHVIRNGVAVPEPFATRCEQEICNLAEFTVPPNAYYVLGDNRGDSSDSRYWGPVPRAQIIGRAFGTYWPPSRFGRL